MTKFQSLTYPGLDWLSVMVNPETGLVTACVTLKKADGTFHDFVKMDQADIGPGGELLLKAAYLCRANLMVADKIARELQ